MNKVLMNYCKFYSLFILLTFTQACNLFEKKSETVSESKLFIVDVNGPELFKDAKIAGSINIGYDEVDEKTKDWNKKSNIVIYCTDYACSESYRVAKKFKNLGFENIQVYKGGIQEWYQLSKLDKDMYPFEGPATEPFLNKEINKLESTEEGVKIITSQNLSNLIREGKN